MFFDTVVKWLSPQENSFLGQLEQLGKVMARGAEAFVRFADVPPAEFADVAKQVRDIEHEADVIAHALYDAIDRSFVTPIDREDLHALTSAIDDVLDQMEECAGIIVIYRLTAMTGEMKSMIRVACEAAKEVGVCVATLLDTPKQADLPERFVRVHALENEGDLHYRLAIGKLFAGTTDAIDVIREKEVLDALENAIDACDDVCDVIRSVLVKNS